MLGFCIHVRPSSTAQATGIAMKTWSSSLFVCRLISSSNCSTSEQNLYSIRFEVRKLVLGLGIVNSQTLPLSPNLSLIRPPMGKLNENTSTGMPDVISGRLIMYSTSSSLRHFQETGPLISWKTLTSFLLLSIVPNLTKDGIGAKANKAILLFFQCGRVVKILFLQTKSMDFSSSFQNSSQPLSGVYQFPPKSMIPSGEG